MNHVVSKIAASGFRESHQLAVIQILLVLVAVVFLPSALRYYYLFSSFAPGVIISCAALCAVAISGILGRLPPHTLSKGWLIGVFVLCIIVLHLGISLFTWSADLGRAFTSVGALVPVLLAVPIVYQVVFRSDDRALTDALAVVRVALLVMTALALLGVQPESLLASDRPIWPFTEPSHYALAASPFFIDGCVRGGRFARWFWLGVMSVLVMILQSVALGVATIMAAACSLAMVEVAIFGLLAAFLLQFQDLTYFFDRIAISHESSNLSALVYLQGVELIQEALEKTRGWGIAFQQLGFAPTNVLATEMIRRVGGGELNLADGSFLAVKLGAEFGVFGFLLMMLFVWKLLTAVLHLRIIANGRAVSPASVTFALCVFTSFFIEVFVRGVGYFSGTAILAFAALGIVHAVRFTPMPTRRAAPLAVLKAR